MTKLSNDLIAQFVKVTNDAQSKPKKESTAYGTIVLYEGKKYVKLDGSELLTPISTTTAIDDGERVMVTIKNHSATVTGNLSEPSAKDSVVGEIGNKISEFEIIIADKVSVKDFDAQVGRIDTLVSDNVLIKDTLTAHEGHFDTLDAENVTIRGELTAQKASIDDLNATKIDASIVEADFIEVNGKIDATTGEFNDLKSNYAQFETTVTSKLTAQDASIKNLETNKLDAESADIKYAKIDFTNIDKATMEYFYATSGLIENVVIGDSTITGNLIGVTIKGDLIEGGTVVAEKLVIKGTDGLYYKLNTDGVTTESEQTDYNSLNGSVITAKSITATKISVDDLVAFDATIGGFNITDNAIYSGVKESIDNTTVGIYLDKKGQIAIGGTDNYIKYYEYVDPKRNLYNVNNLFYKDDLITVDDEGWITAACDNTNGTEKVYLVIKTNLSSKIKPSTTYKLCLEVKEASGEGEVGDIYASIYDSDSQFNYHTSMSINAFVLNPTNNVRVYNAPTKDDFSECDYCITTQCSFIAGVNGRIVFRLSLFEDTTITKETYEYSEYHDDIYNLEIAAKTIKLGSEQKSIEEMMNSQAEIINTQMAELELANNSISASVSEIKITQEAATDALGAVNTDITELSNRVDAKMSSEDVQIAIQSELANGVSSVTTTTGFTFNQNGLTVSKSGSEMSTNIDEDGMSIYRNTDEVLTANNEGVIAYDLHAKTYLIVGENSRFEDYEKNGKKQTGCFWIGDTEV